MMSKEEQASLDEKIEYMRVEARQDGLREYNTILHEVQVEIHRLREREKILDVYEKVLDVCEKVYGVL